MKKLSTLAALLFCSFSLLAGGTDVTTIEGTSLAELNDAFEVLRRFSVLTDDGHSFSIVGQGEAVIYLDGRRLIQHSDLFMTPAKSIDKVEIITEARAEYGGNSNIILITTIKPKEDEFKLEDNLDISASPLFGAGNDLELSGKKGKFLYEGGLSVNYLGTKDIEKRTGDLYAVSSSGTSKWLDCRTVKDFNDISKEFSVNVKGKLGYYIAPEHLLTLRYEYDFLRSNGSWDALRFNVFRRKDGRMDPDRPSESYDAESVSKSDSHIHSLNFSYEGKAGEWALSANLDLYGGLKKGHDLDHESPGGIRKCTFDNRTEYRYGENYLRAEASRPLWKGTLELGIGMDNYLQESLIDDIFADNDHIHALNYYFTPMAYASLSQTFGPVKVDAGLLYQYAFFGYKPFDDDQTIKRIIEITGKRELLWNRQSLQPELSISVKAGEADISTGIYTNTTIPDFTAATIHIDDLDSKDIAKAFPQAEERFSAFLKASWKWIDFKTSGTEHHLPIFNDIDGVYDFNGPDFWSMDSRLTLSPSVAFWKSSLTATLHKQWLDMNVVDRVDDLSAPLGRFQWNNGFELPWGMRLDLNALFRTMGAEGNTYFRKPTWNVNLTLQQQLLKNHLTVSLGINNLTGSFCDSIAFYSKASSMELDFNDRFIHRLFRVTVRYTL